MPARRRPLILAHRGFHRRFKENTKRAIVAARDVGADGVEFDVRTTADGAFILHHNRTRLMRGRQRPIALLRRGALPRWIPTLEDVVRRVRDWDGFLLDVELKEATVPRGVLRLLRLIPKRRLIVTSFEEDALKAVRKGLPGSTVGWLRERPRAADAAKAKRLGARILIVHRRGLRPEIARAVKRHGLRLWTWGVNNVKRARAAAELGVAAIITDRPDLLSRADLRRPAPRRTSPRRDRRGS